MSFSSLSSASAVVVLSCVLGFRWLVEATKVGGGGGLQSPCNHLRSKAHERVSWVTGSLWNVRLGGEGGTSMSEVSARQHRQRNSVEHVRRLAHRSLCCFDGARQVVIEVLAIRWGGFDVQGVCEANVGE